MHLAYFLIPEVYMLKYTDYSLCKLKQFYFLYFYLHIRYLLEEYIVYPLDFLSVVSANNSLLSHLVLYLFYIKEIVNLLHEMVVINNKMLGNEKL